MVYIWGVLALVSSFWSAFIQQIVTFFPKIGLFSVHKFEHKRWFLRFVSILCLFFFYQKVALTSFFLIIFVPSSFFMILSFVINNTRGFRDLSQDNLIRVINPNLNGKTLLAGIVIDNSSAICYPVEGLVIPRHLINDVIEREPRLISYCAACKSCICYDPQVCGMTLTFQVIAVWRRNMIMRDRATGTLWQQATGEALFGQLRGEHLKMVMIQQLSYEDWKDKYENITVCFEKQDAPQSIIPKKVLSKMLQVTHIVTGAGFTEITNELDRRELIFGIEIKGNSKAYPVSLLKRNPVIKDQIGSTKISLEYDPKTNFVSGINTDTGESIIVQSHWWFAWKEFHPETEVWKG